MQRALAAYKEYTEVKPRQYSVKPRPASAKVYPMKQEYTGVKPKQYNVKLRSASARVVEPIENFNEEKPQQYNVKPRPASARVFPLKQEYIEVKPSQYTIKRRPASAGVSRVGDPKEKYTEVKRKQYSVKPRPSSATVYPLKQEYTEVKLKQYNVIKPRPASARVSDQQFNAKPTPANAGACDPPEVIHCKPMSPLPQRPSSAKVLYKNVHRPRSGKRKHRKLTSKSMETLHRVTNSGSKSQGEPTPSKHSPRISTQCVEIPAPSKDNDIINAVERANSVMDTTYGER